MNRIVAECIRVERKTPPTPPGGDHFYEVEFDIFHPGGTMTLVYGECPKVGVGDAWELDTRLISEE